MIFLIPIIFSLRSTKKRIAESLHDYVPWEKRDVINSVWHDWYEVIIPLKEREKGELSTAGQRVRKTGIGDLF